MKRQFLSAALAATLLSACGGATQSTTAETDKFSYTVEQFADLQILRYRVPGFESLTLDQKKLVYYLTEAALQGRDILFDQNGKYNLVIRKMLEAVYTGYTGDKTSADYKAMEVYLKRVWFSNGIHHHYGSEKFVPGFSPEFFRQALLGVDASTLPLAEGQTVEQLCDEVFPVIFDPKVMPKRVNQADGEDLILTSACNYYDGVTQDEAEAFYAALKDPKDETPVSYGLNSRLVKDADGRLVEKVWKVGGLYGPAIEKIVYWLKQAETVAETPEQRDVIAKLVEFYETGDLKSFDDYAILWVKDLNSRVDFVNGFTETYGDPLGLKASWESLVNFKDLEATHRTELISSNAQWFEDHSPVDKQFKKEQVKGVSAKVITAAILAGDLYPYMDNDAFTASSRPAMQTYSGAVLDRPVTAITKDDETQTVTFDYLGGAANAVPVPVALPAGEVTPTSFVASWEPVATADSYRLTVWMTDGEESDTTVYDNLTVTEMPLEGLVEGANYYYTVAAHQGKYDSVESNVISVHSGSGIASGEMVDVSVYAVDGTIIVTGAGDAVAAVYDLAGVRVASSQVVGGMARLVPGAPGIYVVRVGETVRKVVVD